MSEVTCKSGLTDSEKSVVFWGSFLSLLTCSLGFAIKVMTMGNWMDEFGLSGAQAGGIIGASFWPLAITMILFSLIVDKVGYKPSIYMACICQALAVFLSVKADSVEMLRWGAICAGLGHGIVEAVINPACSSMYTHDKSTKLNILHAAWPAGIVLGCVLIIPIGVAKSAAGVPVVEGASGMAWRAHNWWMLIPVVMYGLMFIKAKFPIDERVEADVSYLRMLKEVGFLGAFIACTLLFYKVFMLSTGTEPANLLWYSIAFGVCSAGAFGAYTKSLGKPLFFILCIAMIPLATTELGTDAWINQLMKAQIGETYAAWAIGFSAFIMMLLRFFAGALLHRFNPPMVLCVSAIFSMVGLLILAQMSGLMLFVAFVIYAIGQTFYWPTVLGIVAERFPKGGALTLNTVSAIGMLSVGILGTPVIGAFYDNGLAKEVKLYSPEIHEASQKEKNFFSASYVTVDKDKVKEASEKQGLGDKFVTAENKAKRQAITLTALIFPLSLFLMFAGIALWFKKNGGYKPIVLAEESDDDDDPDTPAEPVTA